MNTESLKARLKVLEGRIKKEIGDNLKCIYCGNDDYDIEAYSCDPKDVNNYKAGLAPGFVPCLLLTCTECGKKRVKTMDYGPGSIHYVE